MSTPLPDDIGRPAKNALAVANITSLEVLRKMTEKELGDLHGVGPKAFGILKLHMDENKMTLRRVTYDERMTQKFRIELEKLGIDRVQERIMFGALGFMVNGKLAVCVGSKDVMYKLGEKHCKKLVNQGIANPVVMGERTMRDWAKIDFSHLEDHGVFQTYLCQSLELTVNN